MNPQYTEAEYQAAKCKDKLPLKCKHCAKIFYWTKTAIRNSIRLSRIRGGGGDFCSRVCVAVSQSTSVTTNCAQCGKSLTKLLSQAKRAQHHFCCQSCAAKYNNAHKATGTRVSKLERWLQEQLPKLHPDLEFHFNRKDTIDGELDIYIPSLKLAFELNGIFHYEPIYGPEKLTSIQSNDGRKFQACLERGIELCIVDVSQMKHFKEKGVLKYLDVIRRVVDLKLGQVQRN